METPLVKRERGFCGYRPGRFSNCTAAEVLGGEQFYDCHSAGKTRQDCPMRVPSLGSAEGHRTDSALLVAGQVKQVSHFQTFRIYISF